MELSFGEMALIAIAIVVLFGPDKLPQIARDLGAGVRKMRGAVEDIKTEIMKETDNPVSEIKREIEKVKDAAKEYNPMHELQKSTVSDIPVTAEPEKPKPSEDETHEGPVSR
ncbi:MULTISPECIES: Sec-independent protein translocase subunit TatA/TatB [Chryseobacterium]|uniref:Sec-independent protein translocase protein TatA n=1 Tax=Chryseobacterium camelliae TaxID=1265445 RepID=A0ABU0TFA7_9FLAO|nr:MULTISPECIES: twin-arginine translocase TatA/TatE family subunit [Chryseobacterium]MDT3406455.1 sec-independent protein translocase protein TatB [Pseudacidovorax intermedius]MDQ1095745.1 sec-independent protein translocase protein TatB [Chryseobacterium camelliae]MDQ1099682.1 sec-independent protein translocase protein TatB [Chryseobacterium sp. SORGH_AS_1048]MDR6087031.1 sec-independent protein translocase protein TatB [Chryseobacterium sp. SORGH_AS_0909]MDR6131402.1 sec-independent protei